MTLRDTAFFAALAALPLFACQARDSGSGSPDDDMAGVPTAGTEVRVVAHDFSFDAPDTISSGWTTFHFSNQGAQTHFFVLDHLPGDRGLGDFVGAVGEPFDSAWSGLQAGTLTKDQVGPLLGSMLPSWWAQVEQTGGVGLLAPGHEATATVELEPGNYVMECYLKTPEGVFHTALGMARQLTVTSERSDASPPSADLEIVFDESGMTAPSQVAPGRHVVAVHYRKAAEGLLANDVHVMALPEDGAEAVVPWMDWMNVPGLRVPAPATFMGGVQEMPAGRTAYFTVDLSPGGYAWISENAENGMVQTFAVE